MVDAFQSVVAENEQITPIFISNFSRSAKSGKPLFTRVINV